MKQDQTHMRILFVYPGPFSLAGGLETVVYNLARSLTEHGSATGIIELSDEWESEHSFEGVPLWTITAARFPTWKEPRSLASYARAVGQLQWVCRKFKADILHVHFPSAQCLPVVGACLFPRKWRLVTTVHNSDIRVCSRDPEVHTWQDRLFRRTDAITSVSQELLEDAIRLYPSVRKKGKVIYNGVDYSWLMNNSAGSVGASNYILFVGRLHPMKAVDVLLRAWKFAHPFFPGTQLWLAGDGRERGKLAALAHELGIEPIVKFLGHKSPSGLRDLYCRSRLVVLPSRHEGLPMVMIEAGACGAVRLGTRVPGITEVITDSKTGFLVEPNSPEAFAEGLIRVGSLTDEERQQISRDTREQVRTHFSLEAVVAQYIDLYREVLGAKRASWPQTL